MSGWATVATAHAISLLYKDEPEFAIGAAAASGGDTDTVASIVGSIVGARHGAAGMTSRWIDGLANGMAETCVAIARQLVLATAGSGEYDASEAECD